MITIDMVLSFFMGFLLGGIVIGFIIYKIIMEKVSDISKKFFGGLSNGSS